MFWGNISFKLTTLKLRSGLLKTVAILYFTLQIGRLMFLVSDSKASLLKPFNKFCNLVFNLLAVSVRVY